jgi:hypothetical protein
MKHKSPIIVIGIMVTISKTTKAIIHTVEWIITTKGIKGLFGRTEILHGLGCRGIGQERVGFEIS